jgi:Zn-dependent protease with chaperone function
MSPEPENVTRVAQIVKATRSGLRRLHPRTATKALAVLTLVAAGSSLLAISILAVTWAIRIPSVATMTGWCNHLAGHRRLPPWIGLVASATLAAVAVSLVTRCRRHFRRPRPIGEQAILVVPTPTPLAYSIAGGGGQIVVSAGMMQCLTGDERQALFAHERAHLRYRHHWYLWIADIASAVPPIRPLAQLLRFNVERWADEEAAWQVGDRTIVASAIARAALAQTERLPVEALALSGTGVRARVEALLAASDEPSACGTSMPFRKMTASIVALTVTPLVAGPLFLARAYLCHI